MTSAIDRRTWLALASASLLLPTAAHAAKALTLSLEPGNRVSEPGQPAVPIWRFGAGDIPRFSQGDDVEVTIVNRLPVAASIYWRGLDGAPSLEPLLAQGAIAPGGTATSRLTLAHAGTMLCDARLGAPAGSPTLPVLPLIVSERTPPEIDRDIVLLIEDEAKVFTLNGERTWMLDTRPRERLRLRFINGAQRAGVALILSDAEVRVIAIDGQPSEPFSARGGRIVLAPGTRIDALVDIGEGARYNLTLDGGTQTVTLGRITATGAPKRAQFLPPAAALPSNGLPDKLALQQALRVDLPLDSSWLAADAMSKATPPVFRVRRGRPVVLTLSNPGDATIVFALHGHHMRLLDRLDDGWKPFWLDTLAIPPKQTVRVAFGATNAGDYLLEAFNTSSTGARLFKSYRVEA